MLVTHGTFQDCIKKFVGPGIYGADTETTGLRPHQGDKPFSLILAPNVTEAFYFNFKEYPGCHPHQVLKDVHKKQLAKIFANPDATWACHNAKFDMAMMAHLGIEIKGQVHCTEIGARIEYNDHFTYDLASCAKRIGEEKLKIVDDYIKEHGLYKLTSTGFDEDGIEKFDKDPCFDQVPLDVIVPYGCKDTILTLKLCFHQLEKIKEAGSKQAANWPKPINILDTEKRLVKTLYRMEETGLKINRPYVVQALDHEQGLMVEAKNKFYDVTEHPFVDSAKGFAPVFDKFGIAYPRTKPTKTRPNGTPSFKDDFLAGLDHPVGQIIRDYRDAAKKANTYYSNFLFYADENDTIHANLRSGGTGTGRMSCSNPNMQNLNAEEDSRQEFIVRKCFVPPEDFCFVMIDFEQQEFRMMLDYAAEMTVINRIINEGLDVHQATADMVDITRGQAKTLNFGLLYGMGVTLLAIKLGISYNEAFALRAKYFRGMPKVKRFLQNTTTVAKERGFIFNWAGRISYFPHSDFAYKAANYIIQGGGADIMKIAMNLIDDFLMENGLKSRMVLQVHDELLFKIHKSELDIVPTLKSIMESVYPHRHLPLTCSVEHSWNSWADAVEGLPIPRGQVA